MFSKQLDKQSQITHFFLVNEDLYRDYYNSRDINLSFISAHIKVQIETKYFESFRTTENCKKTNCGNCSNNCNNICNSDADSEKYKRELFIDKHADHILLKFLKEIIHFQSLIIELVGNKV